MSELINHLGIDLVLSIGGVAVMSVWLLVGMLRDWKNERVQ